MISTTWTSAPAGVSGTGLLAARPAACAAPLPAARLRALPLVGMFGIAPTGDRLEGTAVPATDQFGTAHESNRTNDVTTTLGIHAPGRPLS